MLISILLAAYSGGKYIAQQIESLLGQSVQDFKLFICDDNSADSTFSIISEYAEKYPDKIFATKNQENSGGAKHNFIKMMIAHKDDYIMLCDQDDVWLPDKIEITLKKMQEMESEFGPAIPLLVHTDLIVVNEKLEIISPSYKAAMKSDYTRTKLKNVIVQNLITGCTVMYNRALANLITEIPPFTVMHDWWLMMTASAFGKIAAIDSQPILYRQHSKNELGAKDVRTASYKISKIKNSDELKAALNETYIQAGSFLDVFQTRLPEEHLKLLKAYADIPNQSKIKRWVNTCKLGTTKNNLSRKIAQFIYI